MVRLLVFALAAYALYVLFFKDKIIVIAPKKPKEKDDKFNDYEEIK